MGQEVEMQRRLLTLLDKWVAMSDEEIAEDCRRISKLAVDPRDECPLHYHKMEQKVIKKLASRLAAADRFNLAHDMTVCGNLYYEKVTSYLVFAAQELQSKVSNATSRCSNESDVDLLCE